jgi:hypothetical protein
METVEPKIIVASGKENKIKKLNYPGESKQGLFRFIGYGENTVFVTL